MLILSAIVSCAIAGPDWKPAPCPIPTRWSAEVTPANVHPEYPRPQLTRDRWMNLNGIWEFEPDEGGAGERVPPVGRPLARKILVPFPVESSLSGVGERHERLWYRRVFQTPESWSLGGGNGERLLLHFGAVDWETTVLVNGRSVGLHRGGYDPFSFDITDALVPGDDQEILVGVVDPSDASTQPRGKQVRVPQGIWYTPSTGIWQTVWLEPVPARSIARLQVHSDLTRLSLDAELRGPVTGLSIEWTLIDPASGADVASVTNPVAGASVRASLKPATPKPWTPETPNLYDLVVRLRDGDRVIDEARSYAAFRSITLGPDSKGRTCIQLNGSPYFHIGPLDQGFWPDGLYTAPTDEAMRYDLEQTKALGFNAVRKHVKVEPARWYMWCDRIGLLVWQDMPSGDAYIGGDDPDITRSPESGAQFEAELTELVRDFGSFPCIGMWVVYNEGWGQWDTCRMVDFVRGLDRSRLVSNASGWTDRGCGDVIDIHVYPGPGAPPPEPRRAGVLGEYGGLGLRVEDHSWQKESWGYQGMPDADALTRRYVELARRVHELRDEQGLSAAIYTQTTDVETECNGLLTYDRAVMKMDARAVADANRGRFPRLVPVVESSRTAPQAWRFTTADPGSGWEKPGFDDSAWASGPGGFGTRGTPGAVVGTEWNSGEIWIRRDFQLAGTADGDLRLLVHHDEDGEVYINGVLAGAMKGYTTTYETFPLAPAARAALRPGKNSIAVHCRQTTGGQFIDAGLVRVLPPAP